MENESLLETFEVRNASIACIPWNPEWFQLAELISYLVILPAIASFGIAGNSLIVGIYATNRKERRHSISLTVEIQK